MATASFEQACARISQILDPAAHEKRRWAKEEGAQLERAATFVQQAFQGRDDLTAIRRGGTFRNGCSFEIAASDMKIAGLALKIDGPSINFWPYALDEGQGEVFANPLPSSVAFADLTLEAVEDAIGAALNQIRL